MFLKRTVFSFGLTAFLLGCGTLPASGPYGGKINKGNTKGMAIDIASVNNGGEILRYAVADVNQAVLSFLSKHAAVSSDGEVWPDNIPAEEITVNIGDTIQISIFESEAGGLFIPQDSSVRPGNFVSLPSQTIDYKGKVTVPYAGQVQAAGRTTEEISADIVERLTNKAIEPQVVVSFSDRSGAEVSVIGDVNQASRLSLGFNQYKLLDAVASAGGPTSPGFETKISLQRGTDEYTIRFDELVEDSSKNIYAQINDIIYLYREPEVFVAYGAVQNQGAIPFGKRRVNLSEALGLARGLADDRADPAEVYIYRKRQYPFFQKVASVETSTSNVTTTITGGELAYGVETLSDSGVGPGFDIVPDDTVTVIPDASRIKLTPIEPTIQAVKPTIKAVNEVVQPTTRFEAQIDPVPAVPRRNTMMRTTIGGVSKPIDVPTVQIDRTRDRTPSFWSGQTILSGTIEAASEVVRTTEPVAVEVMQEVVTTPESDFSVPAVPRPTVETLFNQSAQTEVVQKNLKVVPSANVKDMGNINLQPYRSSLPRVSRPTTNNSVAKRVQNVPAPTEIVERVVTRQHEMPHIAVDETIAEIPWNPAITEPNVTLFEDLVDVRDTTTLATAPVTQQDLTVVSTPTLTATPSLTPTPTPTLMPELQADPTFVDAPISAPASAPIVEQVVVTPQPVTRPVSPLRQDTVQVQEVTKNTSVVTTEDGVSMIFRLDLRDPKSFFLAQNFMMEDQDIIYVANAKSVEFSKFLDILNLSSTTTNTTDIARDRF